MQIVYSLVRRITDQITNDFRYFPFMRLAEKEVMNMENERSTDRMGKIITI